MQSASEQLISRRSSGPDIPRFYETHIFITVFIKILNSVSLFTSVCSTPHALFITSILILSSMNAYVSQVATSNKVLWVTFCIPVSFPPFFPHPLSVMSLWITKVLQFVSCFHRVRVLRLSLHCSAHSFEIAVVVCEELR